MRDESDYPAGYSPDDLYEKYKAVHSPGDTGAQVVAKMRAVYGGH